MIEQEKNNRMKGGILAGELSISGVDLSIGC